MAHRHASSGEIVELKALGDALEQHVTHALIKSAQLELVRLVLPAGRPFASTVLQGRSPCSAWKG